MFPAAIYHQVFSRDLLSAAPKLSVDSVNTGDYHAPDRAHLARSLTKSSFDSVNLTPAYKFQGEIASTLRPTHWSQEDSENPPEQSFILNRPRIRRMTMNRQTTSLQKAFLSSIILLTACLTLSALSPRATGKINAQESTPQVINKTTGFQVESLTMQDTDYILLLKNNYSKSINGYTLGTGLGSKLTVDLTTGNQVIGPGGVEDVHIPASNLRVPPGQNTQRQITILAVVFEDATSDGNPQVVEEIKGRRNGAKIQFKRVLNLIGDFLASPEANDPAALNKLKTRITSLSEEPENNMPLNARSGLRGAKQDALTLLQDLEQRSVPLQEGLPQLKARIEKRISRL
jgi:hypothetical protein